MSDLVQRIQSRLRATGKNATSVADEIGANRSLVRDILVGKTKSPTIGTLQAICGPLQCTIGYLVGASEMEPGDADEGAPAIGKFWMVHGINQRAPVYRHHSLSSAMDEAKRLAAQVPGVTFVVLEAMTAFQSEAPKIQTIEVIEDFDDGIPF